MGATVSVARARELALQWRKGALRPEEERELQALLLDGGVLEAADQPRSDVIAAEAKRYHGATRGIRRYLTPKEAVLHAYESGALREYSDGSQ